MNLFDNATPARYKENFSDFELIGGEFHKWIRDNHARLKLNTSADWERFIEELDFFTKVYLRIRDAEKFFDEATKYVYYNAQLNFTLQSQTLMAPVCPEDDAATVTQKINLTARFLDLWINSRVTNFKKVDRNNIESYIYSLTKDIRRLPIVDLKRKLNECYDALHYDSNSAIQKLRLNLFTKKYIKNILARITDYIEKNTGKTPRYVEYMTATTNPFEIEHIICDHVERFSDEFSHEEFDSWRNSIGALLLLHRSTNASLSDSDYAQKLLKYCSTDGNVYAASLGEQTYRNNPQFRNFIDAHNLPFEPFATFGKAEISKRIELVVQLSNLVWNAEDFQ